MKRFGLIIVISLFLISVISLSGCVELFVGDTSGDETVKLLTPEDIESIFASITVEVTEKYPTETDSMGNDVFFWLKGGEVWHTSKTCVSIAKAAEESVLYGTIADALASGKKRACKICSDGLSADDIQIDALISNDSEATETSSGAESEVCDTVELTEKYLKEYSEDGKLIVFWLDSSVIWHESRQCSSLSRSDPSKLCSGCVEDAKNSGKERACKRCS